MKIEGDKRIVRLEGAPDVPAFRPGRPERAPGADAGPRKGGAKPIDWNDAPEPRRRKPKPEHRGDAKPPKRKPKAEAPDPAVHAPLGVKKRGAPGGAGPASKDHARPAPRKAAGDAPRKDEGKPRRDGPKGPPPPKGKPNSKKNRARAAANKAAAKAAGKGGHSAPKRR